MGCLPSSPVWPPPALEQGNIPRVAPRPRPCSWLTGWLCWRLVVSLPFLDWILSVVSRYRCHGIGVSAMWCKGRRVGAP